jgi:hypothetical protein
MGLTINANVGEHTETLADIFVGMFTNTFWT